MDVTRKSGPAGSECHLTRVDRDLALAEGAARVGAAAALGIRAQAVRVLREKGARREPVTGADLASEEAVQAFLAAHDPGTPVVSEEREDHRDRLQTGERLWVVDPVDGTAELLAGQPDWGVLVGLLEAGRPTTGVTCCPELGLLWRGAVGRGAERVVLESGERRAIQVAVCERLEDLRLLCSASHPSGLVTRMGQALEVGHVIRRGSAGVKICLVSEGSADLYLVPGRVTRLWDTCAPEAILRAAGGTITDFAGRPLDYGGPGVVNQGGVVVSGGTLHPAILARVAPLRRERYGDPPGSGTSSRSRIR